MSSAPAGRAALGSSEPAVRARAVITLAEAAGEPGSPLATTAAQRAFWSSVRHGALSTPEAATSRWAALAPLAAAMSAGPRIRVVQLRALAVHGAPEARRGALAALGINRDRAGRAAVEAALSDPDAATRRVALTALARLPGQPPLGAMVGALSDASPSVRLVAIEWLARCHHPQGASALVTFAREGEWLDQLDTLAALRPARRRVRDPLLAALRSFASHPRVLAAIESVAREGPAPRLPPTR